ncbi:MAG TPA: PQQ-dependent sugar dehydrogenase [Vicinamibacterales bacterium]
MVATLIVAASGPPTRAATLPSGFSETLVAGGLASPTAMQFAPDGRLFVAEQGGRLRVIRDGVLLPTPFLTVTVSSVGERGLLGVAFDPQFATNHFVYVYYTATTPAIHNRISRFTANGDVAVAGSEVVLLDLDNLSSATNHNGGALAFGPDGKLYAAVGENANGANAQTLSNLLGKILRINSDGSIPNDNPFLGTATGRNQAIWALGLRNPFTFAFNPGLSQFFINDVGQNTWEEINNGIAAANYGWPTTEGPTTDSRFVSPRYAYTHSAGCAITGGAFYAPATMQFPSEYRNDYFFADYCGGWIRKLDPAAGNAVVDFASGIPSPVDLKVGDDGGLYYLARGSGATTGVVYKISYSASLPTITSHPSNRTVAPGASVTFSVRATGPAPIRYQWQRNGANISGATSQDYTFVAAAGDNGARFRAVVSNDNGSVISNEAVLTVTANQPPAGAINQPPAGTLYSGGSVINYSGTATDPEDGTLPASAFTWRVDFHHDAHVHPFIAPTSGATSGSFTAATTGHTETNVWYRIVLTVRDSGGLTHTTFRDVLPRTVNLTLATNPAGLSLTLDAQPVSTPLTFGSVVGVVRNIGAPATQTSGGTTYEFVSWSDGGAATHNISTPSSNTTYSATYRVATGGTGNGLSGTYYDNIDFTGATVARIDPTVDFVWGSGAPAPGIAADTFSVRWTGQVQPQFSETYTFYTQSDDGVRLWVNGQQIVNNWTNHATTENSGTIALTAGQRYDVRMEFFENGGAATARLSWSSASVPKAVVPSARLFAQAAAAPIRVNFQPASSPVPAGYLADGGLVFAARGNGQSYGWNADNTAQTRDRNASNSADQRYDTLTHLQKPANPDAVWEIALPNGSYSVRIVSGDAANFDSVFRVTAEGVLVVSGTPTTSTRWIEGTATVAVSDGRLTIRSGSGASNNKICFVDITPQ